MHADCADDSLRTHAHGGARTKALVRSRSANGVENARASAVKGKKPELPGAGADANDDDDDDDDHTSYVSFLCTCFQLARLSCR